jgi:hypothetical protein
VPDTLDQISRTLISLREALEGIGGGGTGPPGADGADGPPGADGADGAAGAAGPSNLIVESAGPTNLTVGAILNGELGRRAGSTFVGRYDAIAVGTQLIDGATVGNIDVPGLALTIPRAGTYALMGTHNAVYNSGSNTYGSGLAFSGTHSVINYWYTIRGGSATTPQTVSGTLLTITLGTNQATQIWTGILVCSTGGTLKVQVSRTGATLTVPANSWMRATEL